MGERVRQYVIYRHPADYPDSYVVRGWTIQPGSVEADIEPLAVTLTLADARARIPAGFVRIPASESDDPVVVELWT